MKKSALFLAAAAAVAASSMALAQTIDAPAGSTDTGVRARVAITPVDTSNLATKTEVNNAYNNAVNLTEYRYGQAINLTENRYGQAINLTENRYGQAINWTETRYNNAVTYASGATPGKIMRAGQASINMNGSAFVARGVCVYGAVAQPYYGVLQANPCSAGETFVPQGTLHIDGYNGY